MEYYFTQTTQTHKCMLDNSVSTYQMDKARNITKLELYRIRDNGWTEDRTEKVLKIMKMDLYYTMDNIVKGCHLVMGECFIKMEWYSTKDIFSMHNTMEEEHSTTLTYLEQYLAVGNGWTEKCMEWERFITKTKY